MSPSSSSAARGPRAASPWAHVFRGESEAVAAAPSSPPPAAAVIAVNYEAEASGDRDVAESSETSSENNNGNGGGKRSAWSSKPPNGVMEMGPVMGAVSWPALGESSKTSPKLFPPDSIKTGDDDGSSASDSAPPVPVAANHQMKVNLNNLNPNSNRQKSTKRGGGGNGSGSNYGLQANGGPISPPPPPAFVETPQQILQDNPTGQRQEPSPRDMHNNRNHNNWDHGSSSRGSGFSQHSHGGADHHRPFNRRGNGGAGGPHNGGKRDPDRGGYSNHSNDWNNPSPRHMPPPSPRMHHPRPQFIRTPPPPPPAGAAPFIGPPPPVRPFVPSPMGFPEIASPVFYVPAPPPPAFVAAHPVAHAMPPAVLLNPADYQRPSVLKQIEYYFSNDNLCKDTYLRRHMDEQGWVPVALIAGFNRVRQLTHNIPNNINYILDLVRTSELVEVQGDRIRRRGDWMIWVLHPQSSQQDNTSSPHSPSVLNIDHVVDHMQNVVLEESTGKHNTVGATVSGVVARSTFGNVINESQGRNSNEV